MQIRTNRRIRQGFYPFECTLNAFESDSKYFNANLNNSSGILIIRKQNWSIRLRFEAIESLHSSAMALLHSTLVYYWSTSLYLILHYSTMNLYFTLLYISLPWLYFTLHYSTMALLYSTWLFITLPCLSFTLHYYTFLYDGSTSLYLTLHYSTMTIHYYGSIPCI